MQRTQESLRALQGRQEILYLAKSRSKEGGVGKEAAVTVPGRWPWVVGTPPVNGWWPCLALPPHLRMGGHRAGRLQGHPGPPNGRGRWGRICLYWPRGLPRSGPTPSLSPLGGAGAAAWSQAVTAGRHSTPPAGRQWAPGSWSGPDQYLLILYF